MPDQTPEPDGKPKKKDEPDFRKPLDIITRCQNDDPHPKVQQFLARWDNALPEHVTRDRFLADVALTLKTNPDIAAKCTPVSIFTSLMQCCQLGLETNKNLGHAYLVPFKGVCTLIIGYKGYVDLFYRAGYGGIVQAGAVYAGDLFEYEQGTKGFVRHRHCVDVRDPEDNQRGNLTHAYAYAYIGDCPQPLVKVLPKAEVIAHRRQSRASGSGPWKDHEEAMWCKTALRVLSPWLPKSPELRQAMSVDADYDYVKPTTAEVVDEAGEDFE